MSSSRSNAPVDGDRHWKGKGRVWIVMPGIQNLGQHCCCFFLIQLVFVMNMLFATMFSNSLDLWLVNGTLLTVLNV